jgi:hypothetical protein
MSDHLSTYQLLQHLNSEGGNHQPGAAHLSSCADCTGKIEKLRAALQPPRTPEISDTLRNRVLSSCQKISDEQKAEILPMRSRRFPYRAAAAACFIIALVSAAVIGTRHFTAAPELVLNAGTGSTVNGSQAAKRISRGDRIATAAGGRMQITIGKGYTLTVAEKTTLVVQETSIQKGVATVQFSLESGTISSASDGTIKYSYRTPRALITPTGTAFSVTASESETVVSVTEGSVSVAPSDGGQAVQIHKGQQATVHQSQPVAVKTFETAADEVIQPDRMKNADTPGKEKITKAAAANTAEESAVTKEEKKDSAADRKERRERMKEARERQHLD